MTIDPLLGAARLLQFAAALVLAGAALFRLRADPLPAAVMSAAPASAWCRRLLPLASLLGALSALAWLVAEADCLAGDWRAVPDVIGGTSLGRIVALRAVLFACALLLQPLIPPDRRRWRALALTGAVAAASCAWTGHGAFDSGAAGLLHQGADVLHLLAAAVWIGALAQLCILALHSRAAGDTATHQLAHGLLDFSAIGPAVVALLVLTGLINSAFLLRPAYAAALRSPYGLALAVKVALFGGMLALAAVNRLRLTPRLRAALDSGANAGQALPVLRALRRSLLTETALALLVLAAVALLGMLPPPASGA